MLVGADEYTVKVEDAHAGGNYSLLEVALSPLPPSVLLHAHYDFAETYFVLEGEVLVEVGTERCRAGPRSAISLPVGITHSIVAAKGRPARCLCITDRAQHSDLEYLP